MEKVTENMADALRIDEMQIYAIMYIKAQWAFPMQTEVIAPLPPRENDTLAKPNTSQPLS
jgi:hypothetical protein